MPDPIVTYPFDDTGVNPTNLTDWEYYTVTQVNDFPQRLIIPRFAPFYTDNLQVEYVHESGVSIPLVFNVDYGLSLYYAEASRSTAKQVYGGIPIIREELTGTFRVKYQTVGGDYVADANQVYNTLLTIGYNPRQTWWDQVSNVPLTFPVGIHSADAADFQKIEDLIAKLDEIKTAILTAPANAPAQYVAHLLAGGNPHNTDLADLGAGSAASLDYATDQEVMNRDPEAYGKLITLGQAIILLNQLV